jgi:hypothetical protein
MGFCPKKAADLMISLMVLLGWRDFGMPPVSIHTDNVPKTLQTPFHDPKGDANLQGF